LLDANCANSGQNASADNGWQSGEIRSAGINEIGSFNFASKESNANLLQNFSKNMAQAKPTIPQPYPRIGEGNKFAGALDTDQIVGHTGKIPTGDMKQIIKGAVEYANRKSSRAILDIPDSASDEEAKKIYLNQGRALFAYFKKYCGDPATTAYECCGRGYDQVAAEQFFNRALQKGRMNSGWRYQRIAFQCAQASKRFKSVSDIGSMEADFNVTIETVNYSSAPIVNIYTSVKNRMNTLGGQDWPKAIAALEEVAKNDKNRSGPYLCVFGIAMDRGLRSIKKHGKTKQPHSINTEVWLSDFFWPFFSNYTYEEIMLAVYELISEQGLKKENRTIGIAPPAELVESFGHQCKHYGLIDEQGKFNDAKKLVNFFCTELIVKKSKNISKSKKQKPLS